MIPPVPIELAYLWRAFNRLASRRTSNGFGPNPIPWSDIAAYSVLTGFPFAPWEVEVIEELDRVFLAEMSKQATARAKEREAENKKPPPKK